MAVFSSLLGAGLGILAQNAIGGGGGGSGAGRAANAQLQAARENNALQREIYGINRGNLQPYMTAGTQALGAQQALLGFGDPTEVNAAYDRFRDSTGYQFQFDQGQRAVNTGLGAGNSRLSGRRLTALNDYGQNMANASFGDYYGRVGGMAGQGMSAASALAGVGQGYANAVGNNNQNAADARSNAALINAQNRNNQNSALGSIAGSLLGQSSFGGGIGSIIGSLF